MFDSLVDRKGKITALKSSVSAAAEMGRKLDFHPPWEIFATKIGPKQINSVQIMTIVGKSIAQEHWIAVLRTVFLAHFFTYTLQQQTFALGRKNAIVKIASQMHIKNDFVFAEDDDDFFANIKNKFTKDIVKYYFNK